MMSIPKDEPITIREDLNGSDSTQLEETTDPENPRLPSPQARSSVTITNQYESPITPVEMGVRNPMFDLITIYDIE
jgi:hypothetical protein